MKDFFPSFTLSDLGWLLCKGWLQQGQTSGWCPGVERISEGSSELGMKGLSLSPAPLHSANVAPLCSPLAPRTPPSPAPSISGASGRL